MYRAPVTIHPKRIESVEYSSFIGKEHPVVDLPAAPGATTTRR
jgi:hypothetical protein